LFFWGGEEMGVWGSYADFTAKTKSTAVAVLFVGK
jgi:hypothetical protein